MLSSLTSFTMRPLRSYVALLGRVEPKELLGLTATPERADGLSILEYFDGRIAAELRLWDAIDQQYLAPFDYFGIHDGMDLPRDPLAARTGVRQTTPSPMSSPWTTSGAPGPRAGPSEGDRSARRCVHWASVSASPTHSSWPSSSERPGCRQWRSGVRRHPMSARLRCGISMPAGSGWSLPSISSTKESTYRPSIPSSCSDQRRARPSSFSSSAEVYGSRKESRRARSWTS